MGFEDKMRLDGIKRQCLLNRSRFLFLLRALASSCAGVASKSTRCRVHEFRGAFSSIVPRRTKANPTAVPIVGFSG